MKTDFAFISLLCLVVTFSCNKDVADLGSKPGNGVLVSLYPGTYSGNGELTPLTKSVSYDFVDVLVADENGLVFNDVKSIYYPESSQIQIEGLREGNYSLMVLAARGDIDADMATVSRPQVISDVWISFPEDLHKPLDAEYFYSVTDFQVVRELTTGGYVDKVIIPESIAQERIVSRVDVKLRYNNDDVRTSARIKQLYFNSFSCMTSFAADGTYSGRSDGIIDVIDIEDDNALIFMPTADGSEVGGRIKIVTDSYTGVPMENEYSFVSGPTMPNRIDVVRTQVVHANDYLGTRYVTEKAYEEGNHAKILQDDESKTVFADRSQREFNTSEPLQLSVTDDGRLHARFYSPKPLSDVTIRARVPAASDDFFDLAYFEEIPAFADFFGDIHLTKRSGMYRTAGGKIIELRKMLPEELAGIEFEIHSPDPYWQKIMQIRHGWTIYFSLYGGDPDLPDGGPNGNWMGIRPVHCREVVAFFLNFTYMIDMEEHERILRENEDILYGNGGVEDKVTAEQVLAQMRQRRSLQIGLVYPGNGVLGLGGGYVYGAYQRAWLTHYNNTYSCEVMFHELGHVMGYSHSSSFTYGPWAQELMNNFYVNNLDLLPVESPDYLNSSNNPCLYD